MNILITGASGFIGKNLINLLCQSGHNVIALTRNKKKFHDHRLQVISKLEEISIDEPVDAIINLAGAPIDKYWSNQHKKNILNSRLDVTNALYTLVNRLKFKPKVLISASAVGYYGSQTDNVIDENSTPQAGFTHQVCKLWEEASLRLQKLECMVFIIRLGVVLGKNSGMLGKVMPVFKIGLGGKIGTGKQYISWVHIDDVLAAIMFLLESKPQHVIYNLTAPFAVTNLEWTNTLSFLLRRPAFLPMPKAVVSLMFGEMGESLLLNGQRVIPHNLMQAGFKFKYSQLNQALEEIVR